MATSDETKGLKDDAGRKEMVVVLVLLVFFLFMEFNARKIDDREVNPDLLGEVRAGVKSTLCKQDDDIFKEKFIDKKMTRKEAEEISNVSFYCQNVGEAARILAEQKCRPAMGVAERVIERAKSNSSYAGLFDYEEYKQMKQALEACKSEGAFEALKRM